MTDETIQIDMENRVEEIRQRLDEIEERKTEILDSAERVDEESDRYRQLEDEWREIEGERVELEGELDEFESAIESFGGSVFVVRRLLYGDINAIEDQIVEESIDIDYETQDISGSPKEGRYKILTLRESLVDQPPAAPTRREGGREVPAPGQYPISIGDWLYERVNALNTVGETDLGNSSLDEALEKKRD